MNKRLKQQWLHSFRRVGLLALLLVGLVSSVVPAVALAQEPSPIRLEDLVIGYDGVVRRGHWFPVTVTVSNDGPDLQGELVWRDEDTVVRRAVDLPRGAKKRITLLALDQRNFTNSAVLSLQVGGQSLLDQEVRVTYVDDDVFVVGVIGTDPALLNSLTVMRLPDWSRVAVVRLDAEQVPEQWPALSMLNVLFVGAPGSELWTDSQRQALDAWIGLGGQLVIGGGVDADRIAAGTNNLLPVTLGSGLGDVDLTPLADFARVADPPQPAQASVRAVQPGPETATVVDGLLYARARGAGRTLFVTFDLGTLRGWEHEAGFWERALEPQQILDLGASYRQSNDNLLQSTLQLPGLGLPSTWILLAYLLLYVLLIGPANYLVLRRLDRHEWAWTTVPLTVLLFALGTYALGFGVRGGSVLLNQITIVQAYEGGDQAPASVFVGMFSPRRSTYTLSMPVDALASDLNGFDGGATNTLAPLARADDLLLEDLLVDVGALRTLLVQNSATLPFQVQSTLRNNGATLEGELRIDGAALQQAVIVRGESALLLGDLAAGESREVRVPLNSGNFPWGIGLGSEGTFNRQQVLNSLFSSLRFGGLPGTNQPGGNPTYLLGWIEQPGVAINAIDAGSSSHNLMLYIVRLKTP